MHLKLDVSEPSPGGWILLIPLKALGEIG